MTFCFLILLTRMLMRDRVENDGALVIVQILLILLLAFLKQSISIHGIHDFGILLKLAAGLVLLVDGQRLGGGVVVFLEVLVEVLNDGGLVRLVVFLFFEEGFEMRVIELLFVDDGGEAIHFEGDFV